MVNSMLALHQRVLELEEQEAVENKARLEKWYQDRADLAKKGITPDPNEKPPQF